MVRPVGVWLTKCVTAILGSSSQLRGCPKTGILSILQIMSRLSLDRIDRILVLVVQGSPSGEFRGQRVRGRVAGMERIRNGPHRLSSAGCPTEGHLPRCAVVYSLQERIRKWHDMEPQVVLDKQAIAAFCQRHHITKLALFGSVLTDRFREDSDVDVPVEFERQHVPSLFGIARMERELSGLLARKADLRTPEDLSQYFRDDVMRHASVQYAA